MSSITADQHERYARQRGEHLSDDQLIEAVKGLRETYADLERSETRLDVDLSEAKQYVVVAANRLKAQLTHNATERARAGVKALLDSVEHA